VQELRASGSNNGILNKKSMKNVYNCKKTATGVALVWREGKRENEETFSFPELEAMRIPVEDLLDHPELFRIDLQEHKIYLSQIGRAV